MDGDFLDWRNSSPGFPYLVRTAFPRVLLLGRESGGESRERERERNQFDEMGGSKKPFKIGF